MFYAWNSQEMKANKKGRGALEPLKENMVAGTPAAGPSSRAVPFTPAAPATLMRVPKLGEVFYSQKGGSLCQCLWWQYPDACEVGQDLLRMSLAQKNTKV